PPWLAPAGAACKADEECRSAVCDQATSTCAAPCGDSGLACPAGQQCNAETHACEAAEAPPPEAPPPAAAPPPPAESSCSATRPRGASEGALVAAGLVLATLASARRRRS